MESSVDHDQMASHCFQTKYIWVQHGRGSLAEIILSFLLIYLLETLNKDMFIQHPLSISYAKK